MHNSTAQLSGPPLSWEWELAPNFVCGTVQEPRRPRCVCFSASSASSSSSSGSANARGQLGACESRSPSAARHRVGSAFASRAPAPALPKLGTHRRGPGPTAAAARPDSASLRAQVVAAGARPLAQHRSRAPGSSGFRSRGGGGVGSVGG